MRPPTAEEFEIIKNHSEDNWNFTPEIDNVGIIDKYMPDGPGWFGKAAIVIGGSIVFSQTLLFKNGAIETAFYAESEEYVLFENIVRETAKAMKELITATEESK
jgi:hypothetical protein